MCVTLGGMFTNDDPTFRMSLDPLSLFLFFECMPMTSNCEWWLP